MRPRRRARAHWVLLGVTLVALLGGLLLQGYTEHELGGSSTQEAARSGVATVPGGGAVVYRGPAGLTSRALPPRTVALTFDDGPDPGWTPRILDVLEREHVPGTFFTVGERVAADGPIVRRALAAGDEIGGHTWTHADLAGLPGWRRNLELSLGQLALAGGAGVQTALLRLPYSSTPDGLDARQLVAIRAATDAGYVVVLADHDSEDWRRRGTASIVTGSLPRATEGSIVMFHDAGGDRSQTVAALPAVIEGYRSRGYAFTTVSGGVGLAAAAGDQPAPAARHLQGLALLASVRVAHGVAVTTAGILLPLGVLAVLRTLLLVGFAGRHVRVAGRRARAALWLPPVTVLVPAYNEAVGIAATLRSLTQGDYPDLRIVVIDDGSTDNTAAIVEGLALPGVTLVRQPNAGKAAALNTGLRQVTTEVVVMLDGDTVFQTDTVRWLVQPLADPTVGAVSGNTKVGNRRGVLGRWQHLEYVIGFNLDRRMYDLLRCMPTVPGAVGAFRRSALDGVGGVSTDTLAEDTDLTMAVSRAGHRIVYEERAIAWTEAPATLTALWRQRYRWCYGTLQSVWKHRGAVIGGGPQRHLGLVGLPYLLCFQVLLPLLAPVVDVYAIYGLLFLDPVRVLAFYGGFLALQVASGAYALHLDREPYGPLWTMPLQQFVYRQLMYLVVIQSVVSALSGIRLPWQKLERTGDATLGLGAEPVAATRV